MSVQEGTTDRKLEEEILKAAKLSLGMGKEDVQSLMQKMVERHAYLFPPDIQPKPLSPFMFLRQEVRPFDDQELNLSNRIAPLESDDRDAIDKLRQLDDLVMDGADI
ncbi:MAG: hypothetical protein QGI64_03520 [Desulfobacterales bacterium]|nr:hypothetical protein [Desulfobacterales bacterium]